MSLWKAKEGRAVSDDRRERKVGRQGDSLKLVLCRVLDKNAWYVLFYEQTCGPPDKVRRPRIEEDVSSASKAAESQESEEAHLEGDAESKGNITADKALSPALSDDSSELDLIQIESNGNIILNHSAAQETPIFCALCTGRNSKLRLI